MSLTLCDKKMNLPECQKVWIVWLRYGVHSLNNKVGHNLILSAIQEHHKNERISFFQLLSIQIFLALKVEKHFCELDCKSKALERGKKNSNLFEIKWNRTLLMKQKKKLLKICPAFSFTEWKLLMEWKLSLILQIFVLLPLHLFLS